MPFVTGAMLEGEHDCGFDTPSLTDVENLFENLLRAGRGTLTLEGANNVQLSLSLAESGSVMVNWHSWDSDDSFVIVSDRVNVSATETLDGAEYPAQQFVDQATAIEAARRFFDDGAREPSFSWATPA